MKSETKNFKLSDKIKDYPLNFKYVVYDTDNGHISLHPSLEDCQKFINDNYETQYIEGNILVFETLNIFRPVMKKIEFEKSQPSELRDYFTNGNEL
jgi:hypothetical protein